MSFRNMSLASACDFPDCLLKYDTTDYSHPHTCTHTRTHRHTHAYGHTHTRTYTHTSTRTDIHTHTDVLEVNRVLTIESMTFTV